jgi:hypothetical protein
VKGMREKKTLPIGNDDFRKLREGNFYYIDKTLMIRDFIEMRDEVALITRPRRFGKTLNMTMMREFFDITKDSRDIFRGLNIMDTEYAEQINSRPVVYFSFKNVKGRSVEELTIQLKRELRNEYAYYDRQFQEKQMEDSEAKRNYYKTYSYLSDDQSSFLYLSGALADIIGFVYEYYRIRPILLIDEYDQPIMSSYERGYRDQLDDFFSNFFGSAMKGNQA